MLDDYLQRFHERSAYETARTAPPPDFPALPDLPLGRYVDPAFYELEREHLWRTQWLYAVHASELDGSGSYAVRDIAGAAVLVVRGDDGAVRAFANACRHRGAPVVRDECGTARQFSCLYHSWTYDLHGALVRVPEERDFVGLDRSQRGLPSLRCENWGDWYFVNFDLDAQPLLDWLRPLPETLGSLAAAKWRILDKKSVHIRCNWKVLAEGFLEVYHARTIHPTTVAPSLKTAGTVISLYQGGHSAMISPANSGGRNDGREELPLFDGATGIFQEGHNAAHGIFPNLITPLDGRGFPFLVFWPDGRDRTRLDITWFVVEGERTERTDELWERRLQRFDQVMEEDYANLEPIQRSMENASHGGQVLNYQERRIWHVHAQIDKVIGAERIAEALRVPDLLHAWVDN